MKPCMLFVASLLFAGSVPSGATPPPIWIEAESPSRANFDVEPAGWGDTDVLSEGRLLSITVPAREVGDLVPEEGILMEYGFEVDTPGSHEIWNRIGMEYVRSPFEWRVDAGIWNLVLPSALTTDLMSLQRWNEIAWLRLGTADLAEGSHTLGIRVARTHEIQDGKRSPERLIYMSDALVVSKEPFRPNGKHRPGARWQTEADRAAAAHVFRLPSPATGHERVAIELTGDWQVARLDEPGEISDRTGPIERVPEDLDRLYWYAMSVPGDRNRLRPQWTYCHRYLYRTRVHVPESVSGRSFFLRLHEFSLIATVFVNGTQVGWSKAPFALWTCDVTGAVRAGAVNEIVVGIKDAYYAQAGRGNQDARRLFNLPIDMMNEQSGTLGFDFPVKGHLQNGLTDLVEFVAAGEVYTEDVFAMPSVENRELALEVTLMNPASAPRRVGVTHEVRPLSGGPVDLVLDERIVDLPPGLTTLPVEKKAWEAPRLWWPDDPWLYEVDTSLRIGDRIVDADKTTFGFREWTICGTRFCLNGVPWKLINDQTHTGGDTPQEVVALWKRRGMSNFRLRYQYDWFGLTQREVLDLMDREGMPVRRTGIFDGQHASYSLALRRGNEKLPNSPLFENWMHHLKARVRGERNHPSIYTWGLDNEIIFINARNFGNLDVTEPAFERAAQQLRAIDPTRACHVGGGRALMNQSLPVYGCHYEETDLRDYPDEAYSFENSMRSDSKQPWPMSHDRPIFLSEFFYAGGWSPQKYAGLGGERAFLGKAATRPIASLYGSMLAQGYRWIGIAGMNFWLTDTDVEPESFYRYWSDVAVLCREWNWTFAAGEEVTRTLKVLNDTRRRDPIDVSWHLKIPGHPQGAERRTFIVPPGSAEECTITITMPAARDRLEGELILSARRASEEVFRDVHALSVIDPDACELPSTISEQIAVWDPSGVVRARMRARGVAFHEVEAFEDVSPTVRVLVVGPNTVSRRESTDPRWLALAARGTRVLVLDQEHPLSYQAVPADFELTRHIGRVAFPTDLEHAVFAGLRTRDFFMWSGDHVVYRNAYRKASTGARTLVECDDELSSSAIALCPVNDGLLALSQVDLGRKLKTEPVARRLFDNLLSFVVTYEKPRKSSALVLAPGDPRRALLDALGLEYQVALDPLKAISKTGADIVILDATPGHLRKLASATETLKEFTDRGGWLMLWGVTPDGLPHFNSTVGIDHLLRPFRRERVALAAPRDRLAAGLSQRDVVLYSGERIFGWRSDEYVADDVFSYVVDLDDLAPFTEIPENAVNGMTSADAWKYIYYHNLDDAGRAPPMELHLPRRETVTGIAVVPNLHYHVPRRIRIVFDGDQSSAVDWNIEPTEARQDFEIPNRRAEHITLEFPELRSPAGIERGKPTGIDNLWILVHRSDEWHEKVRPLLNIGALVRYPRGKGGIILNQLRAREREVVPVNREKKQTIVGKILDNLGATFRGRRTLVPGEGLRYQPVSLEEHCNLHVTSERGWPLKEADWSRLPVGRQKFQDVVYDIRDFKTSPLENAVTLRHPRLERERAAEEISDIHVGRTADAVFFLHSFVSFRPWSPRRRDDKPPVIFRYVIRYAGGETTEVPVIHGRGAAHWLTPDPAGLRDAGLAWSAPAADGQRTVLYYLQWKNPRPDVEIESIAISYGGDGNRWGAPVIFGITTARSIADR